MIYTSRKSKLYKLNGNRFPQRENIVEKRQWQKTEVLVIEIMIAKLIIIKNYDTNNDIKTNDKGNDHKNDDKNNDNKIK